MASTTCSFGYSMSVDHVTAGCCLWPRTGDFIALPRLSVDVLVHTVFVSWDVVSVDELVASPLRWLTFTLAPAWLGCAWPLGPYHSVEVVLPVGNL